MAELRKKVYVDVVALHDKAGGTQPLTIEWEDGRKFLVDRVVDVRRAASLKAGGAGIRYTIQVLGKETYLFFDDGEGRWFVEAVVPPDQLASPRS